MKKTGWIKILKAVKVDLFLFFCFCVFVFLQPAFQPVTNVSKDLFAVQLHQQLMPGAGVQLDLDILHTSIQQALDRPLHTCALFAHRVGIACQEQQGQILGHPGQKNRIVQPQDAAEHAVIGVQGKDKGTALVGAVAVHLHRVTVEPVVGRAALQPLVVPQKRKSGHQFAAVVPAMEHGQHPADGPGQLHQRFGLVAGAHDDGTVQLIAPLTEVLPRVERAHAVAQQEIGHAGIQLLCQGRHSVQILQHGAVAVGFAEVAVILFGADGPAVAQVVVAGDKDAPGGQILGQRLIAVDELHHPVGELQHSPHLSLRHTAERVERPPRLAGRQGKVDHLAHGLPSFSALFFHVADLLAAGGADAVACILDGIIVHLAAEIAAAGGAVFFEDDLIAFHKDLQLGIVVQLHAGAQLLGQDDTAQAVNAADDSGTLHSFFFSFVIYTSDSHFPFSPGPDLSFRAFKGKLCHLSHSVYKISNHSSMFACSFDKKIFLLLPNAHSAKSAADSLTKQRTAIKLKGSDPQFFACKYKGAFFYAEQ